ncbi:hypothetical protein [Pontibacter sp. HJ8]
MQIQSARFPLVDRNPQKHAANRFDAKEENFIKARHKVYDSPQQPHSLKVKVL